MKIVVHTYDAYTPSVELDVACGDTVGSVKVKIRNELATHPSSIRLLFAGEFLEDGHILSHYNIQDGSILRLIPTTMGKGRFTTSWDPGNSFASYFYRPADFRLEMGDIVSYTNMRLIAVDYIKEYVVIGWTVHRLWPYDTPVELAVRVRRWTGGRVSMHLLTGASHPYTCSRGTEYDGNMYLPMVDADEVFPDEIYILSALLASEQYFTDPYKMVEQNAGVFCAGHDINNEKDAIDSFINKRREQMLREGPPRRLTTAEGCAALGLSPPDLGPLYEGALNVGCIPADRVRVILLGDFGSGKTSTLRSIKREPFKHEYESTEGASIDDQVNVSWVPGDTVGLNSLDPDYPLLLAMDTDPIWVLALDPYLGRRDMSIKMSKEDIERVSKAEAESRDRRDLYRTGGAASEPTVRNPDPTTSSSDQVTPSTDIIDDSLMYAFWDFAGQTEYHLTHQVFFSAQCVYMLVIDLTRELEAAVKTAVEWLSAVYSCVQDVKVIMVGTKANSLPDPGKADEAMAKIKTKIGESICDDLWDRMVRQSVTCVIDNEPTGEPAQARGLLQLRRTICNVANEALREHPPIPVRWFHFAKALQQFEASNVVYITMDQVKECLPGMESKDIEAALSFFHRLGQFLHFPTSPGLEELVFPNPQRVVDVVQTVVSSAVHPDRQRKLEGFGLSRKEIRDLTTRGVLSDESLQLLLQCTFERTEPRSLILLLMNFDVLLQTSVKNGTDGDTRVIYTVPSLLPRARPDANYQFAPLVQGQVESCCELVVSEYFPIGLFGASIARIHRKFGRRNDRGGPNFLYRHASVIVLRDSHRVRIEKDKPKHRILLRMRGPCATGALIAIVHLICDLLRTKFPQVKCTVVVPMCTDCDDEFNVIELLDTVFPADGDVDDKYGLLFTAPETILSAGDNAKQSCRCGGEYSIDDCCHPAPPASSNSGTGTAETFPSIEVRLDPTTDSWYRLFPPVDNETSKWTPHSSLSGAHKRVISCADPSSLQGSDRQVYQLVLREFERDNPKDPTWASARRITRITVLHNSEHDETFLREIRNFSDPKKTSNRVNSRVTGLLPKPARTNSVLAEADRVLFDKWQNCVKLSGTVVPSGRDGCNFMFAWHGSTDELNYLTIAQDNMHDLTTGRNLGWYGSGPTFSSFPMYCETYALNGRDPNGPGRRSLLLSAITAGSVFPVCRFLLDRRIDAPFPECVKQLNFKHGYNTNYMLGTYMSDEPYRNVGAEPLKNEAYTAHVAHGRPLPGNADEIIVARNYQVLPAFIVEYELVSPSPMTRSGGT